MSRLGPFSENTIVVGDCLDIMAQMPDGCVDLVVTDPPYASGARREAAKTLRGAMSRANGADARWFEGDSLTTLGLMLTIRLNSMQWARLLVPRCHAFCFTDWRMYPAVSTAIEMGGLRLVGCVVWDKVHFGIGWQFRNQHEFIIVASKGRPRKLARHDVGNVIAVRREKANWHPTEKPEALLEDLISATSFEGDLVFDPFIGSGTTAVVADRLGRKFFGCDISSEYVEMALERLEKDRAGRQLNLL